MAYQLFTIEVRDDTVYGRSSTGAEEHGAFAHGHVHKAMMMAFDRWLRKDFTKLDDRADFEALGSLLHAVLLDNRVGELLRARMRELPKGDRMRIELQFDFAAEFAGYPWEFLFAPPSTFFATDRQLVLSRYMALPISSEELRVEESHLRLMFIVARPRRLGPVVSDGVVESARELESSYDVVVEEFENPTIDVLEDLVEEHEPHILHYIGHGQVDPGSAQSAVALTEPDGEDPQWIDERSFSDVFKYWQPRLVVLQSCEVGAVDWSTNFAGLAPRLLKSRIPAVIAMQYPVYNKPATTFGRALYGALAAGEPVDGAVQDARLRVARSKRSFYADRDFGAPVLYMRSPDGLILPTVADVQSEPHDG